MILPFIKRLSNDKRIGVLNKVLFVLCSFVLSIAIVRLFSLRWNNVFLIPEAVKDEVGFVEDFHFYLSNGWYASVASGTSPLFNLAGRFIYVFTGDALLSLKLVSVLSLVLMVVIWSRFLYKDLQVRGPVFFIAVLFLINVGLVRSAYFNGCDDPLFIVFISLGFIYIYRSIYSNDSTKMTLLLAGLFCAFALSVRPLFIYYSLGFISLLFLYYKLKRNSRRYLLLFFLSFGLTVVVIQYPSLKEKGSISVHNKDFKKKDVTWAEINYLFLLRNKEHLLFGRNNKLKPTPDEVLAYKQEHGPEALPRTYRESVIKNPVITFKNFIGLLYLQALPFVRQLGIFYLFFFVGIVQAFRKKQFWKSKLTAATLFYLLFALLLCITPVVHLEFRWFMAFTFLITVFAIYRLYILNAYGILGRTIIYFNILLLAIQNALLIGIW